MHSSVVGAPLEDVFAWHQRPGAVVRLTPPWQPVTVARESESLRDGSAVLKLPGGVSWVAQHRSGDYDPPRRFVDELVSLPLPWRHRHDFAPAGERATRVTDVVDTPIPARFLRPMFRYRHRQLADDLAVHQEMSRYRHDPFTVAMTGSTGLVGSALTALLSSGGHRVIRLVRHPAGSPQEREWRPDRADPDVLAGVDALVHLAGAPIGGRFSAKHKTAVRDSRVGPTRLLADAILRAKNGPGVFVVASAIGGYGPDRGDEPLTESSPRGEGFVADLVADWEAAAEPARAGGVRVVHVRTGIVQSPRGGTLRLLRPLFQAGLGGPLGGGRQWTSWIDIDDTADIYYRAVVDADLSGPVNAAAPEPVRNREYTATLAGVLHRPALLPVPGFGPRLVLGGEGAKELADASQRVMPQRLLEHGHRFRRPTLEACLRHQLGRMLQDNGDPAALPVTETNISKM